jgi:Uma2 family endonuclease
MNAIPVPQTVPAPPDAVFYPCEDGEPLAETEVHVWVIVSLLATLRDYFKHRPDYYVNGDMFLYWEEGNPEARRAPDVMVVKGVEPKPPRDFFKIWEERATPCVIIEITSPKTADEDREVKYRLYERLGVKEYFLFDPRHEYLERPLLGYRLINNRYEALMPSADGCLVSSELQMLLCPEDQNLVLIDFKTGKRILPPLERAAEAERRAQEAMRHAEEAEREKHLEQQRAAEERLRAQQAERERVLQEERVSELEKQLLLEKQRAAELAQELARLRAAPSAEEGKPAQ